MLLKIILLILLSVPVLYLSFYLLNKLFDEALKNTKKK